MPSILSAELADDPLGLGYAGMTHAEAAAALTAPNARTIYRDVPVGRLAGVMELRGIPAKLEAVPGDAPAPLLAAVGTLRRIIEARTPITSLGYADPAERTALEAMLDGLGDAGVLSVEDVEALQALGSYAGSRAEELGLGAITELDVKGARDGYQLD